MEDVIEGMRLALAVRVPNVAQSSRFRQSPPREYLTAQYAATSVLYQLDVSVPVTSRENNTSTRLTLSKDSVDRAFNVIVTKIGFFPVRPEPVEGPFMVRQAHHERCPAHLFSLSVVPIIGMIDCEAPSAEAISESNSEIASLRSQ